MITKLHEVLIDVAKASSDLGRPIDSLSRFTQLVGPPINPAVADVVLELNRLPEQLGALAHLQSLQEHSQVFPKTLGEPGGLQAVLRNRELTLPTFSELVESMTSPEMHDPLVRSATMLALLVFNGQGTSYKVPKELAIGSPSVKGLEDKAFALGWLGHIYEQLFFIWANRQSVMYSSLYVKDCLLHCLDEVVVFKYVAFLEEHPLRKSMEALRWINIDHAIAMRIQLLEHAEFDPKWNPSV